MGLSAGTGTMVGNTRCGDPEYHHALVETQDDEGDDEMFEEFRMLLIGMVAEADLRGMSPLAVFFEFLDKMHTHAPEHAKSLESMLPRATRAEYRQWRGSQEM